MSILFLSVQDKDKVIPFLDLQCTVDMEALNIAMETADVEKCTMMVENEWFEDQFCIPNMVFIKLKKDIKLHVILFLRKT